MRDTKEWIKRTDDHEEGEECVAWQREDDSSQLHPLSPLGFDNYSHVDMN